MAIYAGVGTINGTTSVVCVGNRLGDNWTNETAGSESWTGVTPSTDTWTLVTAGSEEWTPVTESSDTWTNNNIGSETWR
jgi:hypothetical protein